MHTVLLCTLFLSMHAGALEDIYYPNNVSRLRTTLSGIAEYRSALTLDWLAAEDTRQRELALAFETEAAPAVQVIASECISYPRPASGKVARLMLELLKNLEGDDGVLIPELIQALVRAKLLVETSMLDAEPDLDSLVKTPGVMMGEPYTTFPRILAMVWMAATDPTTVNKDGWCPIDRVTRYVAGTSPAHIAQRMHELDSVVARSRYIMEEFVQHVTPNMYDRKNLNLVKTTFGVPGQSRSRNSLRIHVRPKLRQQKMNTNTSLPQSSTPYQDKFEDHKHVLVNNPIIDEETKSAARDVAQISVCLLLCVFTVIARSLIMTVM